jgi:ABC-type sugar transport system substrate-binding protein
VAGRAEEAVAVALAVALVVALAVAEDVALAVALGVALPKPSAPLNCRLHPAGSGWSLQDSAMVLMPGLGEALDEPLGRHSPLSSTSSELAQSGVSSPTTSPVCGSMLSPGSSWRFTPDCAKATDASIMVPSIDRPTNSSSFLKVSSSGGFPCYKYGRHEEPSRSSFGLSAISSMVFREKNFHALR